MPVYTVDYGPNHVAEGLFLRRMTGREEYVEGKYQDIGGDSFRHISTFPGHSTIKESMLDALDSASQRVFFTTFLIQEKEIVSKLIDTAERLHGRVYVLTTLQDDDFAAADDLEEENEGTFEEHIASVERLTRNGISVKARKDCHAKFMVVDDQRALITSANAVPTCLRDIQSEDGRVRSANPENGLLFTNQSEVFRLANLFRAIWREGYHFVVAPGSRTFNISENSHVPETLGISLPEPATSEGEVIWTAPGRHGLRDRIIHMLDNAKERVRLSTWVIKGMAGHSVGKAIISAAERGVEIAMLVRGMNYRDDLKDQCYRLVTATDNVKILGDYANHSKAIVADGKEGLVLTANLDAQHGLDNGVEVGYWSADENVVRSIGHFLDRLFGEAAFEFVAKPTQSEVSQRYHGGEDSPLDGDVRIKLDLPGRGRGAARAAGAFCEACRSHLVSVKRHVEGNRTLVVLTAGGHALYLSQRESQRHSGVRLGKDVTEQERDEFICYLDPCRIEIEAEG